MPSHTRITVANFATMVYDSHVGHAFRKENSVKKFKRFAPLVLWIIIFCALAYIPVTDMLLSVDVANIRQNMIDSSGTEAEKEMFLKQATAFNRKMGHLPYDDPEGGILPYEEQLRWQDKPYMAYVRIPKAHVSMPIYYSTSGDVQYGIAHTYGTSLPVGGGHSCCVLEGYDGIKTTSMFNDIKVLDEGDVVCVYTLGDEYFYKVVSTTIVSPPEVANMSVITGKEDKLLLVAGSSDFDFFKTADVSSQRYVVTLERCEYSGTDFEEVSPIIDSILSPRSRMYVIGMIVVLVWIILWIVFRRKSELILRQVACS